MFEVYRTVIVLIWCSVFTCTNCLLQVATIQKKTPSRCNPVSVENNSLSFKWISDADPDLYMVRIFHGNGGLSGVNLCRPLDSRLCGNHNVEVEGICPLNGTASLSVVDGLHVIHVLVVSKDGSPAGAHETFLLQVPAKQIRHCNEFLNDHFEIINRCGHTQVLHGQDSLEAGLSPDSVCAARGYPNDFVELAQQCLRSGFPCMLNIDVPYQRFSETIARMSCKCSSVWAAGLVTTTLPRSSSAVPLLVQKASANRACMPLLASAN
jgi:hypothetical protein